MDQETKDYFNSLLEKPMDELTSEEKLFLQARQSYMGKKTREQYKEVLGEKVEIEEPKEVTAEELNTNSHPSELEQEDEEDEEIVEDEEVEE